jgi:hypothetical protein
MDKPFIKISNDPSRVTGSIYYDTNNYNFGGDFLSMIDDGEDTLAVTERRSGHDGHIYIRKDIIHLLIPFLEERKDYRLKTETKYEWVKNEE